VRSRLQSDQSDESNIDFIFWSNDMTINKSAIALAVCAALGSTAAMAASYPAGATRIYLGGATATDNTLEEGLISQVGGLCNPSLPINIYRAANQRVVICTTRASLAGDTQAANWTNFGANRVVAIHKESNGGSSNGIVPIKDAALGTHNLQWLNVNGLTGECTVSTVAANTNLAGYINHNNCSLVTIGDAQGANPHGGISDTEPELSSPAVLDAGLYMTLVSPLDIVFGIPVTKNLYQALQIAQFGDTSPCDTNPAANAYTISDTNPACVPSLNSPQIRSLYSQAYADWDSIIRRADGTPLSQIPGVVKPVLVDGVPDTAVRICRRVASSGTQAGAESFWLGQRCVATNQLFATPSDNSTVTDTTNVPADFVNGLVNAAVSSGNVRTCLQTAQTGNWWGIGVLSTEVTASNLSGAGDSFRFVAIDGYAPTLANVTNGNYQYFTSNVVSTALSTAALSTEGQVMRVLGTLILGNPAVLANLNATFAGRPWGNGGILAKQGTPTVPANTNTAPYSDAEMSARPVNTLTKGGNNCLHPWAADPTPTMYNAPLTPAAL
jgi:hypothetical protein